jgi:hypothetical protein
LCQCRLVNLFCRFPYLTVFSSSDLVTELQCGVDTGRGREDATRLLVVFLRAKSLQRLVHPVLTWLVTALPLDSSAPPRLASASLEALGELALATGVAHGFRIYQNQYKLYMHVDKRETHLLSFILHLDSSIDAGTKEDKSSEC